MFRASAIRAPSGRPAVCLRFPGKYPSEAAFARGGVKAWASSGTEDDSVPCGADSANFATWTACLHEDPGGGLPFSRSGSRRDAKAGDSCAEPVGMYRRGLKVAAHVSARRDASPDRQDGVAEQNGPKRNVFGKSWLRDGCGWAAICSSRGHYRTLRARCRGRMLEFGISRHRVPFEKLPDSIGRGKRIPRRPGNDVR
jgi:hypothetical protein